MARLDEICSLNMGQSPDSSSYNKIGNGLPFFQGNADFGALHPNVRIWCNAPTKVARPGDILISVRAPIGALNIADRECCIGRGLAALTVDKSLCNSGYLWYAIANKVDELNSKGTGSTFKAISKNVLGETEIPLPSLDQQQRVSSVLDKLTDLIFLRKQQLSKLDELVKARFVEIFGEPTSNPKQWKKEPLGNHANILTGFPFDSSGYVNDGIKICGGLIIMPGKINWADCKWWPNAIGYEKYLLADSDIVMALDRPWISDGFKIALISKDDLPSLLIQRTARIRAEDMNQLFIYSLLQDDNFSVHCNVTGSLVPHISHKDIKSYPIIVPPIELQNEFSTFSQKARSQKLTIQQSLDTLEALKKSLMQEYFG